MIGFSYKPYSVDESQKHRNLNNSRNWNQSKNISECVVSVVTIGRLIEVYHKYFDSDNLFLSESIQGIIRFNQWYSKIDPVVWRMMENNLIRGNGPRPFRERELKLVLESISLWFALQSFLGSRRLRRLRMSTMLLHHFNISVVPCTESSYSETILL